MQPPVAVPHVDDVPTVPEAPARLREGLGLAVVFRLRAWRELRSLASTYFGRPATT